MGGIAGWLDFERDLSTYRGVVLAQLGTLAPRGPDDEGVFVAPHLVAGHRARAVVERGRAKQPVTARGPGGEQVTLLLDGQVYNWRDLRAELAAAGHEFTGGDAETAAHAYLRWGSAFAERLDGMFAIVVWDADRERLLLVRDRLGVKPLFYQRVGGGLTFGSEPKALLAHPLATREVDAEGLRELLAFTSTPGRAVFRHMRRVLPGGAVEVTRDGVTEHRYWELTAAPHPDDRETTIARVRELLDASVARQLGADTPPGVLLSGGVDSSTVAALAARELARRGAGPLRTYTIGYPGGAAPSTPGPMRSAEDAPFAAAVAAHIGAEHTYLELDPAELLDPVARGSAVAAQQDMPVAAPQFPASLRLLCRHIGAHSNVVLAGEQADTVFASFMGMDDPAVIGANTYPWIAATRDRLPPAGLGTGLFAPDLLAKLDVPGYLADAYHTDLARVPRLDGEDPTEARMREIYFLHLQGWQEFGCALDDGVSAAEGVELRWPYCDHRLVQYLYNVPWSMKTSGGPKGLLRAAAADLLPASVLNRAPSQFPTGRSPAYVQALRREAADVLSDPHAPVRRLVDLPAVQRALRAPFEPARAWRDLTDLELVLQLNQWLTSTAARLSL